MSASEPLPPVIVDPADQRAVWFLGVLSTIRIDGAATGGALSVVEHREERGHATPLHRHDIADETFLMIDGTLRVEVTARPTRRVPGPWLSCRANAPTGSS